MRSFFICVVFAANCLAAPPEVAVVRPIEKEVADSVDFAGRTEASTIIEIRARVTGYIDKVAFKEGSIVKKGDLLFQLDDRIQKAEVAKADAELRVAEAKLQVAEANLQRLLKLLKAMAIGKEEVDSETAAVEAAKASTVAARANLEIAKLNQDYTRIKSPITGKIGRCRVDAGNLVKGDGESSLATVVVTDPLFVTFDVDEQTVLRLIRMNRDHKEATISVGVHFIDEKGYPHKAAIDFMDNHINPQTGTVRARATLANPNGEWMPGMFARVRVALGEPKKALVVPADAVVGSHVLVVGDNGILIERPVRGAFTIDNLRVIENGLKSTDLVVRYPSGRKVGETVIPRPVKK